MTKRPVLIKGKEATSVWHRGAVKSRPKAGQSQSHKGVAPLHPITHRNTSYQPLPRPLGLAPYHYDLEHNFPAIVKDIKDAGNKMVFHVVGDTGGVQDG